MLQGSIKVEQSFQLHWKLTQKSIAPKSHLWQDPFVVQLSRITQWHITATMVLCLFPMTGNDVRWITGTKTPKRCLRVILKNKESSTHEGENIHHGYSFSQNILARVHPPSLCNLAGAYLLDPTYACPVVCLSELLPRKGTDKTLCC